MAQNRVPQSCSHLMTGSQNVSRRAPEAAGASPSSERHLRVLLVSRSAADERMLRHELYKVGYAATFAAVASAEALRQRLAHGSWHLVIADAVADDFGALAALEVLQANQNDIPVIVVSRTANEEDAVRIMRAGASDYLSIGRLARLGPVVDRVLKEREERRGRRQAERAVREREQQALLELAAAYEATVAGWSNALDLRDRETDGHSRRVTDLTVRLARTMGVTEAEIVHIRRGALLHDIGKMGIPDGILLKPAALTPDEWVIMRQHPTFAYQLLAPIEYLRPALDIPYCHHERWDGTGYPRGLKATEIPLAARMFAAIDIWDALRSDRPYRPAWTAERSRAHLASLAGTHLDPAVVTAFLALLDTDERAGGTGEPAASSARTRGQHRILVVDDYAANVKLLKRWLGEAGYDVVTASSGHDALRSVAAQPPDLVLLDILIPEPDGVTVCRTLKGDPTTARIPVIFMSGMEAGRREADARQLADDYIAKPIDVYELRTRVRDRLAAADGERRQEVEPPA